MTLPPYLTSRKWRLIHAGIAKQQMMLLHGGLSNLCYCEINSLFLVPVMAISQMASNPVILPKNNNLLIPLTSFLTQLMRLTSGDRAHIGAAIGSREYSTHIFYVKRPSLAYQSEMSNKHCKDLTTYNLLCSYHGPDE